MRWIVPCVVGVLAAFPALPSAAAMPRQTIYGHAVSLIHKNGHYELKFDPAWFLTGFAAKQAALRDTGSTDVPNDYYIVDDDHRLLTFLVSPRVRATVLTRHGTATVGAAELMAIVAGKDPRRRGLSGPKAGYWITIGAKYPNYVVTLEQQYQP